MSKIKVLLVGAGGYGENYVKEMLYHCPEDVECVGVVDKYLNSCALYSEIQKAGIPTYETMEAFYEQKTADLVTIATPPIFHCEQARLAMEHGAYVLTEKPLSNNLEEAFQMAEFEKTYGKFLAVGYQWSYSDEIQAVKKDILSGVLGAPVAMKTAISWPRSIDYYNRGCGWGGKIRFEGKLLLDSVASNACAHYIHNMLFLLGETMESSVTAKIKEAQCLRANDIENFDTCVIKAVTENQVPIYFAASHAAKDCKEPQFVYEFENATVSYVADEEENAKIKAVFKDGTVKVYGDPFSNQMKKLYDCLDAIRTNTRPICTATTAIPHTKLITELYETTPVQNFSKEKIKYNEKENRIYVEGLYENLLESYAAASLLPEEAC